MRDKCSPNRALQPGVWTFILLILLLSACGGSRAVTETEGMPADSVAAAADSTVVQTPVPATLPRVPTRVPQPSQDRPQQRPAYAEIQLTPMMSDAFREQFGITDPVAWSSTLGSSIVSLGSCSGAIVSADGLVVTSATCLEVALREAGAFDPADPMEAVVQMPGAEQVLAGLEARVVRSIQDVTAQLADGAGQETAEQRESLRRQLQSAAPEGNVILVDGPDGTLLAAVLDSVDVHLVFRPEQRVSRFGGEYGAGTYPQSRFDVAFLRLMRNGQPLATPNYLTWAPRIPRRGLPVFAAGSGTPAADDISALAAASGGQVRGYAEGPMPGPSAVTLYSLFDHHESFRGRAPWSLPDAWLDARSRLSLSTPLVLASTAEVSADMLGGPLLSLNLGLVGTIYDTNFETAGGMLTRRRMVAVSAQGTDHVLDHVYNAQALLAELRQGAIPD